MSVKPATKKSEPTAYAKAMKLQRKQQKERDQTKRGTGGQARVRGRCGAKKRNGAGRCSQPAGFGTDHHGFGHCKYHGGSAPSGRKSAAKERAVLMGAPMDINPLDALIWCIKITAGEVEFCSKQLEILDQSEWVEQTIIGKQIHLWAKLRSQAVERLAKFSKDALALGIAERAVRLAEQYGQSIAKYTNGIINDLMPHLDKEGQKQVPLIVRKHLALLEGGAPVSPQDRNELPAIPRRVAG